MKILVDADACPVKGIILETAKQFNIEVIMFSDTSHILDDTSCKVITVDKSSDSADIALANHLSEGDIVVTQDYGVAAMAIGKKAYAMNQNGMEYTKDNIERLLFERFLSAKVRRAGKRTSGHSKRTKENNEDFKREFIKLCDQAQNSAHSD